MAGVHDGLRFIDDASVVQMASRRRARQDGHMVRLSTESEEFQSRCPALAETVIAA